MISGQDQVCDVDWLKSVPAGSVPVSGLIIAVGVRARRDCTQEVPFIDAGSVSANKAARRRTIPGHGCPTRQLIEGSHDEIKIKGPIVTIRGTTIKASGRLSRGARLLVSIHIHIHLQTSIFPMADPQPTCPAVSAAMKNKRQLVPLIPPES